MAAKSNWGPAATAGLALGYGIFVRADQHGNQRLLLHELAHTAQYERLGFRGFLEQYVSECLGAGYPRGMLEAEARQIARKFHVIAPGRAFPLSPTRILMDSKNLLAGFSRWKLNRA